MCTYVLIGNTALLPVSERRVYMYVCCTCTWMFPKLGLSTVFVHIEAGGQEASSLIEAGPNSGRVPYSGRLRRNQHGMLLDRRLCPP